MIIFASGGLSSAPAEKRLGIGIIFAEPTGVNGKLWVDHTTAFSLALGISSERKNPFQIQADYYFAAFDFFQGELSKISFSFGTGARFKLIEENSFSVRTPFDIDFFSEILPLNIFLQVVPTLELAPRVDLFLRGALGVRYVF